MTVGELIEKLQALDPGRVVVLARDSEGNGFGALDEMGEMGFDPDDGGSVHLEGLTDGLKALGYTDEDVRTDGTPALVFWP